MESTLFLVILVTFSWHVQCQRIVKKGAMSYVVSRGCPYLTHYVRNNYFGVLDYRRDTIPTTTVHTKINWATYVYDRCIQNYIPTELVRGLIDCGEDYALYAVKPEQYVIDNLHVDFSHIPGVVN